MRAGWIGLLLAGAAAGAAASAPATRQVVTGPAAIYWMSAATTSGFGGMMGGGGGGRPSMASIMAMRNGGGFTKTLILQLGSQQRPTGEPQAEHDPPEGLGAGPMLPLVTPQPAAPAAHVESEPGPPPEYHQPHGRMLIFWGCGEHAGPGQPLVIDFATLGQGAAAQQFMALSRGMAVRPMQPPSPSRSVTYGEWPNAQSEVRVPPQGSLVGAHVVKGDYTPEIRFTLAPGQDFLPPIQLTSNVKNPTGSATLAWAPVDGARAYFATMIGAQGGDQVVMWTSSGSQSTAFALPDYLSNGEIERLVGARALMAPATTSCLVPQEAVAAAGRGGFFQFAAYGGETNLSWPPRPPAPRPWNIAWEVKLRAKSTTAGMLGMDLNRMMGGRASSDEDQPEQQPQQKKRPSLFNPLGSFIPH